MKKNKRKPDFTKTDFRGSLKEYILGAVSDAMQRYPAVELSTATSFREFNVRFGYRDCIELFSIDEDSCKVIVHARFSLKDHKL